MISGIIAEYNIFHNGHKYQINEVKKHSDAVVAVMSGSFVQRGDVAVTDKWTRAGMALSNGADLVLELPVCYALNAAPNFAAGGINTFNTLGVIDEVVFGSESGDISELLNLAHSFENESYDVSLKIKEYMAQGITYPAALSKAYENEALQQPNNILAIEYIRALIKSESKIKPVTIKRTAVGHNDDTISDNIASASKIRNMLFVGEKINSLVPYPVSNLPLQSLSRLDNAVLSKLRLSSPSDIQNISEMSEGLENRIISAAQKSTDFNSLIENIKTKRYTMSRIRRIVIASLLNFTKDIYSPYPEYIRVLGMNKKGMEILKMAKKVCTVPIITKTADFKNDSPQFNLDLRATDIACLCSDNADLRFGNKDLTTSPLIIG